VRACSVGVLVGAPGGSAVAVGDRPVLAPAHALIAPPMAIKTTTDTFQLFIYLSSCN
jgi:hypothetical protein